MNLENIKKQFWLLVGVSFLVMIWLPLSNIIIDLAIVVSISLAVTVYLNTLSIKDWDQLKTFPTILLIATIFRVALNVATTRKILLEGDAGSVIESSGQMLAGNDIWIGFLIFIILIIVQTVVTFGAARNAEVKARMTLDGMQMAEMNITNDLNNGAITAQEAMKRREKLGDEVNIYGSLDGTGKFIKGDVLLGVALFAVNIIFGFIIGVFVNGMPMMEAAELYTILTIGDGLVNQSASLLFALSTGVFMARVYSDDESSNVTESIFKELTFKPAVLYFIGGLLIVIGIISHFPFYAFALIGVAFIAGGYSSQKREDEASESEKEEETQEEEREEIHKEIEVNTEIEPIQMDFGMGLIQLMDKEKEESVQNNVYLMRREVADEMGVRFPSIRLLDDISLSYNNYRIRINETTVAEGEVRQNKLMALKTQYTTGEIEGEYTKDPVFGEEAVWISKDQASRAKNDFKYDLYDPLEVITIHLNEVIRENLHNLIQRQEVKDIVDKVSERHKIINEQIDKQDIDISIIEGVMRNLLRENVSVKGMVSILTSVVDGHQYLEKTGFDPIKQNMIDEITAIVREKMSDGICEQYKHDKNKIYAITIDPSLEKTISTENIYTRFDGYFLDLEPKIEKDIINNLINEIKKIQMSEIEPVIVVGRPHLRMAFAKMMKRYGIPIAVLSANEIMNSRNINHQVAATIGVKQ